MIAVGQLESMARKITFFENLLNLLIIRNHWMYVIDVPKTGLLLTLSWRLNNISEFSPYLKENTILHHYKDRLVNAVQGNSPRLQWQSYKTHEYKMHSYWLLKQVEHILTTGL
jgi:hypothetical protein